MAKLVQRRRGTTAEHSAFTGANGEITHDTDKETIVVHDGTTQGGFPLAREDLDNVNLVNRIGVIELNVSDGADGQVLTTDGTGHLSFTSVDVAGSAVGGDLTGTVSNAQIGANTVGITELDVEDGTSGQLLTTNGSGVLSFESPSSIVLGGDLSGTTSNAQIVAGAVGTTELATDAVTSVKITDLNVTADKLAVDSVTTLKIADAQVTTSKIADSNITLSKMAPDSVRTLNILDNNIITSKIGDSQVTKLKIADNSVDVAKLDVTDGNSGDILSTNGAGVLSFVASLALGGDLTGTTDNAVIADGAVEDSMIVGVSSSKVIGGVGIVSMQVFESLGGSNNAEQTWTKPAGVSRILYFVAGGGGTGTTGGGGIGGNGGASGATAIGVHDVSGINSLQLRVGTGGAPGGSQSQTSLPNGFNSYLGDLVPGTGNPGTTDNEGTIATGGGGRQQVAGIAVGGDFRLPGNSGTPGQNLIVGRGGLSFWAPFGKGGGGGGTTSNTGNPTPGGRGNDGVVVIFEFA